MRRISTLLLCLLAVLFVGSSLAQAEAGRGRHKRVYVVPAPKKIAVDGKLNDWDLSGQIWIYVQQDTAEMGSAKYAMMYDKDALYISGEVRDQTPMLNRHDPKVEPQLAWAADVCQIFISLDPKAGYPIRATEFTTDQNMLKNAPVSTLYLWYYTDRQEPSLAMFRGMHFTNPVRPDLGANGAVDHKNFKAAYVKAADGKGYTFEYRIPWDTLGMASTPQPNDLLSGVVCMFWGDAQGLKNGGVGCTYDVMASPGFPWQDTTCWGKVILSEKGNLPKELVEDGVMPEPPLPLTFNYEMPKDGETSIALLDAEGRPIRHVVTQASAKQGPTAVRWNGLDDKGVPLPAGTYRWKGIYHDPITTKFRLSVHNSGNPPHKKEDGTGGWGGDHSNPSSACAVGDDMLLLWPGGEAGSGLIRTDLNGQKKWGITHGGDDAACDGQRIYLRAGGVVLRDFADGRTINFGNGKPALTPPAGEGSGAVTGLAYHQGTLYVAFSGKNLIGVYAAPEGTLKEAWPVPAPGRVAVAPDGRVLAISEGRVVVVTKASAAPLIADHLDNPTGIAVDAQGNIYVANTGALQNVSAFDATGKYLRSIGKAGGRPLIGRYEADGMLEPGGITVDKLGRLWVAETPDSPRRHSVWSTQTGALVKEYFGASEYSTGVTMDPTHPDEVYCHNVIWKVDLDKGTWAPKNTLWRKPSPDAPDVPHAFAGTGPAFHVFTAKNGKQYGWSNTPPTLWLRQGDIFVPLLQIFRFWEGNPYPALTEFAKGKNLHTNYMWRDLNGDAVVQVNEVFQSPINSFRWVDADVTLYAQDGYRVKVESIADDGRPVYNFAKVEKLPIPPANDIWVDPHDQSLYTVSAGGIARWNPDGKLLWNQAKVTGWHGSLNLPPAKPGEIWGVTDPLGVAGEITGVMTYFGPVNLYTRDGLFVAQIMTGKQGWADRIVCESFYGNLVKLANGRTLLLAGDQDGRVTEVLGLESIQRFEGTYTISEADVKAVADAKADFERMKATARPLNIVRGKTQLAQAPAVGKQLAQGMSFNTRAAYDEKNLYLQYEVEQGAELGNVHPDANTLFKGGNCLDLQLATDSAAADAARKTPAPGDVRLLVTRQNGKPMAVLYRPKVKGFAGEATVLTSPVGKEVFDVIEVVSEKITLEYRPRAGGFTAVVTVPLALLEWQPKAGSTVKMDVGYIFGVKSGNLAEKRAYWHNDSFTANVVNDIPHESRLEPAEWGTATIE